MSIKQSLVSSIQKILKVQVKDLKFTLLFDILEHQLTDYADSSKELQDLCD